jgi:hypothetical protein
VHIVDVIAARRDGRAASAGDLRALVLGYTATEIPAYQMVSPNRDGTRAAEFRGSQHLRRKLTDIASLFVLLARLRHGSALS